MKRFFKAFCVALALIASTGSAWAQAGLDLGTIMAGISDMNNWYFVNLTAKNSTTSGGSGKVRLMTIDMGGSRIYDQFMGVDINEQTRMAGWPNGNPQPWAAQMTQLGFSIIYMPGVNADLGIAQLSTYAHYAAWAKADDGSYFAGWSYTNGATDLGVAGAESDWDKDDWTEEQWYAYCVENGLHSSSDHWVETGFNEGYWEYDAIYKNDKLTGDYLHVEILPDNTQGFVQNPDYTISGKSNRTLYATFLPVKLVDYTSYMGQVEATPGKTGQCAIEVRPSGKNIDDADFNDPVIAGEGWAIAVDPENDYKGWEYDEERGVIYIDVVFTAPDDVVIDNEYKTTLTFSSKAGSTITVPVSVRAVDPDRQEATLKIGEEEQNGSFADMLAAANAATEEPVVLTLNKEISGLTESLVFNHTMTLNLNGNMLRSEAVAPVRVEGGVLTVAYSKYQGDISGNGQVAIEVAAGELVLEGGNIGGDINVAAGAKLTQNGASIEGSIVNAGTTIVKDGNIRTDNKEYAIQSTGNLTIDGGDIFATQTAVYVEAGSALLKKGLIHAYDVAVKSNGNTTIEKLAELVINGEYEPDGDTYTVDGTALVIDGGTTTINCGKFDAPTLLDVNGGTLNFVSGYFKSLASVEGMELPAGMKLLNVTAGPEYRDGYIYFVGNEKARLAAGVPVCTIGTTGYAKLEDALAYANNNKDEDLVIVLQADYTLPAGYYTLPAKAMLLIPFEDGQETGYELITRIAKNSVTHVDYIEPFEHRRLTMAEGAHLDVFGTVEISGRQFASDEAYAAVPYAGYGLIYMTEGASITMQGGSLMRAWGYMMGKGEMDVRRGAIVREQFQMGDWKGGTTSMNMLSDDRHVFPLTQYWMQNIESPVKYHAGAILSTATSVSAALGGLPIVATANDIKIIGIQGQGDAMFLMSMADDEENTWVRKWYDVDNDIQTYEVYSAAHIGSMVLDLGNIGGQPMQMHSGWFNLPITNNMKIHLLYGYMDFTQNTELLPGAEVEIDKESTVAIVHNEDPQIVSGSLYIYDADDWDKYAYDGDGSTMTKTVKYSPSWFAKTGNGTPTARGLNNVKDAQINVHGTFDAYDGDVFTSEGGANIFSTNEDAGTFKFLKEALTNDDWENVFQVKGRSNYEGKAFNPAWLKNGNGQTPAYAKTAGTAEGKSYCYINNRWTLMEVDPDDDRFMVDNYGDYYAKPNAYVAVAATKTDDVFSGNTDHTYSGKYEQDRLFILTNEGQWWEVTVKDNLYYSADNDMYYVYDNNDGWVEKMFTITWKNWDGSPLTFVNKDGEEVDHYSVPYGTMAEYRSTNPEREANVDYTYDFTGWSPALGKVTTDVTYTATYTSKQRQYTIIFQTEGGAEIERQFLVRDEFPVCENEPSKPGHILKWEPALAAVTGNATYTATWLEEKPATWNIRFVNYDGVTPVGDAEGYDVAAGTMPEAPATPVKPATDEFTYEFTGWKPALENATRDLTYTAQFKEVERTYAITFTDENNNVLGSVQYLPYGAAPAVPHYTKEATAQYTYTMDWSPKVVAVSGDQTYKAVATPVVNKYTVTCQGDGCVFTGAGIYEYGAKPTITVAAGDHYTNAQWVNGPADGFSVTGNVTFTATATFVPEEGAQTYTITFLAEDGTTQLEQFTLAENAIPSYNYTKAPTDQYTYLTAWSPTIQPVHGDMTYKADLTPILRQYTITCEGENCIIGGAGTYDYGTEVTLTLAAAEGYENAKWSDETTGNKVITVTGDATYTASAQPKKFTITCEGEHCIFTGAGTHDYGTEVTLTLAAAEGYENAQWSDGTTADKVITVTGDATYTASAQPKKFTITCEGEGCIFTGAGTYDYGTEVTLTLAAADGYENAKWSDETTGNKVITVIGDATYTASATSISDPDYGTYERIVTAESYGTLCLPQSGTITGATLFTITSRESDNKKLYCDAPADETHVEAGVPYIFYAYDSEIVVTYESLTEEIAKTVNGLVGTNTDEKFTVTDEDDDVCMLSAGKIVHAEEGSYVNGNRAYIRMNQVKIESNPAPVPGRRRIILGEKDAQITTGTENTFIESEPVRKIMIDGQLYILSEGKMFNIMGQVVK